MANTRRTAAIAAPLASDSPNFWSSWAVEMNSWVWASTPTVTRTSTSWTMPASPAMASRRSISIIESTHDVRDSGLDGSGQFGDRFVVAVQRDPLGREVGMQRDGQFAAGADVQRQAFLVDPAGDFAAQERLAGIVHVGAAAERGRDLAAARPEVVLVDDEQRRAVLLGERRQRDAADADHAVVAANGVARPDIRCQLQQFFGRSRARRNAAVAELFGVPGPGGMGVHIRSGALTPRMARPLAITWRVA